MAVRVSRESVTAFRLHAQNLTKRCSPDDLPGAAGACGVQNSPPGSALLAVHARVSDVSASRLDQAVAADKTVLQTWCMRGAPFFLPTVDAWVFTTGVLPPTDEALRQFIRGVGPAVDLVGLSVARAVHLIRDEVRPVLTGRRLAIDPLGKELALRVAGTLSTTQRRLWEQEGPYAAGQPLREAIVHFCLRILCLERVICFAPRDGNTAPFVLVDEWLGQPPPEVDGERARAELLRRYLRCYGPSTRGDFASWLGMRAGDIDPWWNPVAPELTQVAFGGGTWILTEDVDILQSPPTPRGVRLLPPHDPYTQARDRDTLVPTEFHRDVWRTVGDPGTVLADGEIVGIWRPRKRGKRLALTVQTFNALPARTRNLLVAEAQKVAVLRDAASTEVEFSTL